MGVRELDTPSEVPEQAVSNRRIDAVYVAVRCDPSGG